MDNIPIIFIIIIFLLILAGWIIAEVISKNARNLNKINSTEMKRLIKEKASLETSLNKEIKRSESVSEELAVMREFEATIPTLKKNHNQLTKDHSRSLENIDKLRVKLKKREYSSNPVTSDVLVILEEYFPNEQERQSLEDEKLKGTFSRIKNSLGGGEEDT